MVLLLSWCVTGSSWQLLPPPSCPGLVRFDVLRQQLLVFTNPRLESSKDLLAVTMPRLCQDQYSHNLRRWDLAIRSLLSSLGDSCMLSGLKPSAPEQALHIHNKMPLLLLCRHHQSITVPSSQWDVPVQIQHNRKPVLASQPQ